VSGVSTRLRSAEADPHIIEMIPNPRGAGRPCRSRSVTTLPCAGVRGALPCNPFPGSRVRHPPGERPTSRPCSTDESVATSRRFQRCVARVSHGLVSPSRSSLFRRCPPVPAHRSARVPVFPLRAEARKVPWEGASYRSPGTRRFGPFPAASCEGVPQHPFVGCSRRPVQELLPGLVSPRRPRSLSGSESREPHFRRVDLLLPEGVRRRCLAGLHGVFYVKDLKCRQAAFQLGIRTDGLSPAAQFLDR
jgi:hypothetical protein